MPSEDILVMAFLPVFAAMLTVLFRAYALRIVAVPRSSSSRRVGGNDLMWIALPVLLGVGASAWLISESHCRPFSPWSGVFLGSILIAILCVDSSTWVIPDMATYPLIATGLALAWEKSWSTMVDSFLAAALAFLLMVALAVIYRKVRGTFGLGLGDAKLFAAAGAWVGLEMLSVVALLASLSALAVLVPFYLVRGGLNARAAIPFGPFLALGIWVVWLHGTAIFS